MSKKIKKRVNGGLAVYAGIGSLITSVLCFIAMLVFIYRAVFMGSYFGWDLFLMMLFLIVVSGGMAYALLRVGYEEIEN